MANNYPPGVTGRDIEEAWGGEGKEYWLEVRVNGNWDFFYSYLDEDEAVFDADVLAKGLDTRIRETTTAEIIYYSELPNKRRAV